MNESCMRYESTSPRNRRHPSSGLFPPGAAIAAGTTFAQIEASFVGTPPALAGAE